MTPKQSTLATAIIFSSAAAVFVMVVLGHRRYERSETSRTSDPRETIGDQAEINNARVIRGTSFCGAREENHQASRSDHSRHAGGADDGSPSEQDLAAHHVVMDVRKFRAQYDFDLSEVDIASLLAIRSPLQARIRVAEREEESALERALETARNTEDFFAREEFACVRDEKGITILRLRDKPDILQYEKDITKEYSVLHVTEAEIFSKYAGNQPGGDSRIAYKGSDPRECALWDQVRSLEEQYHTVLPNEQRERLFTLLGETRDRVDGLRARRQAAIESGLAELQARGQIVSSSVAVVRDDEDGNRFILYYEKYSELRQKHEEVERLYLEMNQATERYIQSIARRK